MAGFATPPLMGPLGRSLFDPRTPAGKLWLVAIALGLLTYLAYANSFSAGLVLDNGVVIGDDPRIKVWNADNLELIRTRNYWWPMFESDLYRPLTTYSYLINYAVLGNGQEPLGYHVINFLLHWANVVLVLVIVQRLCGRLALAALAAAIFAIHPINIESVTNIVGRADLLATLSILLGGWCYMRAGEATGLNKVLWLAGMGLNALWGVFAKESALMIFAFVFLYDLVWRWPKLTGDTFLRRLGQSAWEFGVKGYTGILPALIALLVVRYRMFSKSPVFGQIFVDNPVSNPDSWLSGKLTAIKVIGRYLQLLIFPRTLSSEYSYNQIPLYGQPGHGAEDLEAWVALIVVAGLIGLAVWYWRKQPLFTWGVGLFFLMQLLTANLIFPIGSIMGERFLYLPSVGFAVMAALFLFWLVGFLARQLDLGPRSATCLTTLLAAVVLVSLGLRSYQRNFDWQDDLSLWHSAVENAPNSFKSYKGYATAIWADALKNYPQDKIKREAKLDQAIAVSETGLHILDTPLLPIDKEDNTLFQDMGNYYSYKGDFLRDRQQPEEARIFYQKSLAVLLRAQAVDHWVNDTSRQAALAHGRLAKEIPDVGNYHVYLFLEQTYERLEDWPHAEEAAHYIVLLNPTLEVGYRLRGVDLFYQHKIRPALIQFMAAGLLDNTDNAAWQAAATCFQLMGVPPSVLRRQGDNNVLDDQNPEVREDLNDTCVAIVQQFLESKQFDNAVALRDRYIKDLRVPADRFPKF